MSSNNPGDKSDIITVTNLQSFFLKSLEEINQNSTCPLPQETLYYSSNVLDKYSLSEEYFELKEGKLKEKVLGQALLEATKKTSDEQKRIYRDIADTALFICGYFADSLNKKIVDGSYYQHIGVTAYRRLNNVIPRLLDVPSFFDIMATSFENVTEMIATLAHSDQSDPQKHFLIHDLASKKVS